jgi:Holliday junction resolvase RusA-like endonuclease
MTTRPIGPDACARPAMSTYALFTVRLPAPPGINASYRGAHGGGRLLLTDAAKAWKEQAAWLTRYARDEMGLLPRPPYVVTLGFYWPSRRFDVDGGIKLALDALFLGLGMNDRTVDEVRAFRRVDKLNPRLDVMIRTAEEGRDA